MSNVLERIAYRIAHRLSVIRALHESSAMDRPDAVSQMQLALHYRMLVQSGGALPQLGEVGFKAFSQSDEDGILLYLFSIIGVQNRKSVEICAGNGIECNTANLIINHGWSGLLVDGNEALVKQGRKFYAEHPHTWIYPPVFVHSWITRDNVNQVIADNGFAGEIDLLSIDMDGVDYWIWEVIDSIDPRVVVIEYQDILGPNKSVTVPYRDNFCAGHYPTTQGMPNFCGASLAAFVKLASKKGYRLVGCNRYGFNAFFVRNGIGEDLIPMSPIEDCFTHPKVLQGMRDRSPSVKDLPWVEV